jgi:DNA-binding transcriptional LysR family regulator
MAPAAPVATKNTEQGVQPLNTLNTAARLQTLDWDDLRLFLKVARLESLRAAADAEGVSVNTVRARIERLESAYGAPLLRRSRKGSSLTGAGEAAFAIAREMQSAAFAPQRQNGGDVLVCPGELRISCSEGVGLLWLTPRLGALGDALRHLTVSLSVSYHHGQDRSSEADIVLAFQKPSDPEMIVTRIATLHLMMFASVAYLREHGIPATLDEMKRHRFVEQVTPGVNSWLHDFVFGSDRGEGLVPIRTNSSLAQLWAVANGAGIAPMPTYVRAITKGVVPMDPPLNLRFDLFCSYHPSARGSPAIESTLAWLRNCFDAQACPWFRSDFVHPDDFRIPDKSGRVVSLFDGLVDIVPRR